MARKKGWRRPGGRHRLVPALAAAPASAGAAPQKTRTTHDKCRQRREERGMRGTTRRTAVILTLLVLALVAVVAVPIASARIAADSPAKAKVVKRVDKRSHPLGDKKAALKATALEDKVTGQAKGDDLRGRAGRVRGARDHGYRHGVDGPRRVLGLPAQQHPGARPRPSTTPRSGSRTSARPTSTRCCTRAARASTRWPSTSSRCRAGATRSTATVSTG